MAKRSNKQSYKPRNYESLGGKDIFVGMYGSMLMSPAFLDLSPSQKVLLLYMRFQVYESTRVHERTPQVKYKETALFQDNKYFHFSQYYWKDKYKLYGSNTTFYKDKKALIAHGFIVEIANGKTQYTQTVYTFSEEWKSWTKEDKDSDKKL